MKGNLIISRNNGFYNIKNNLIKVNIDGNFNKVTNPYRITDLYIHGNKNNIEVIGNGKINHIKVFGNNNKIYINNNSNPQYNDRGRGNELIKKHNNNNNNNNFQPIFPSNTFMPMTPFLINNNINYNNNKYFLNQNNHSDNIERKLNTIMNNLEEKKYYEISINLKAENFNKCSLCKNMFLENENVLIYSCKLHIFHKDCLKNWIKNHIISPTCPTCSNNINNLNSNLNINTNPFMNRPAPQPPIFRIPHLFENNNNINIQHHHHSFSDHLYEDNDSFYDDIEHFNLNDDDNDFEDDYDDSNYSIKKGLNKNILDNMEISKMKNVEKLDTDKKKCTICLENYQNGDDTIALPCIHIFHADCIKTWLKNNITCPICKNEIKYDDGYEIEGGGSLDGDDDFY